MIVHPSTKDEWGSAIETMVSKTKSPFVILAIDNEHPYYLEAVARIRRINLPYPAYILREPDYLSMVYRHGDDYEPAPCIQVFSQGINTGHYTIEELLQQTDLTTEFIMADLGQEIS